MLKGAGSPARWGRLYLALTLVDPDDAEDLAHLPSLVQAAWQARVYHLRLRTLDTASRLAAGSTIKRGRLGDVLASFDVSGNIMLSSILVEALAACDAIEPMSTLGGATLPRLLDNVLPVIDATWLASS